MATLVVVVFLAAVFFFLIKSNSANDKQRQNRQSRLERAPASDISNPDDILCENQELLRRRWEDALRDKVDGKKQLPNWYFDPHSEKQRAFAEKFGVRLDSNASKKQASDIIGLFLEPVPEDADVLKFFKVATKGLKETTANDQVASILADEEKLLAWQARPASQLQKEALKYLGDKPERGLTMQQASKRILHFMNSDDDAIQKKLDEWSLIESLFEDTNDSVLRADEGIKKISYSLFRDCLEALIATDKKLENIACEDIYAEARRRKPELAN